MDESSVEYNLSVIKRPAVASDLAFVFSTWRNQAYFGALKAPTQPSKIFFKKQTELIKQILETSTLSVACLESDPDLVIGYCVHSGHHLYWVYVKKDYRNKGIATLLVPKDIKTVELDLTETGNAITKKKGLSNGSKEG